MKSSVNQVKISATVSSGVLEKIDALVKLREYPSRSALIEDALDRMLRDDADARIEREASKLRRSEEQAMAEEGMSDYKDIVGDEGTF